MSSICSCIFNKTFLFLLCSMVCLGGEQVERDWSSCRTAKSTKQISSNTVSCPFFSVFHSIWCRFVTSIMTTKMCVNRTLVFSLFILVIVFIYIWLCLICIQNPIYRFNIPYLIHIVPFEVMSTIDG